MLSFQQIQMTGHSQASTIYKHITEADLTGKETQRYLQHTGTAPTIIDEIR